MLQRVLQRSLTRPALARSLVRPASVRLFSVNAAHRQESGTLKPTNGNYLIECYLLRGYHF